ncbi:MAG: hypothetical protein K1X54_06330 [Flavobacteriales bacterium]|nr:hypothetical protein [Flavobacteriales bacterium]
MRQYFQNIVKYPFLYTLIICITVSSFILVKYRWKDGDWKRTVQSDGCGYYAYLPAIFIYQDLQYRFYRDLKHKYDFGDLSGNFLQTENNRHFNRYFCGTSIAIMPFFLLATVVSYFTGQDIDGHSFIYNAAINFAAIFYVLSGLYLMYRLFSRRYNKWIVAFVCTCVFLGTNTLTYTVYHSSYSHAYSFGFICLFIYLADRSIQKRSRASVIHLALCLGMVALIRPTNAIVMLAIPFLCGDWKTLVDWFKVAIQPKVLVPSIIMFTSVIAIQSLIYHAECGLWWADGYPNENFYFDRPEIINMWFSYRAGVLLWSPITILGLMGLVILMIQKPFKGVSFFIFMFCNSWIISSWWAWHYSGTFGMRPMVDFLPFFIPLICSLIHFMNRIWLKTTLILLMSAISFVGYTLNKQYMTAIIPWDGMTKEKYWYIFMKTGGGYAFRLFEPYRPIMPEPKQIMIKHITFDRSSHDSPWLEPSSAYHRDTTVHYSGFGLKSLVHIPLNTLSGLEKYYTEIKLQAYYTSLYNKGELYVNFKRAGQTIHSEKFMLIMPDFKPNQWNDLRYSFIKDFPPNWIDQVELEMHNGPNLPVYLQKLEFTLASL